MMHYNSQGVPVISVLGGGAGGAGTNTLGMSNLGNTSGTSGVITGTALQYLFAGGNNITLSQSINGASATLTISAGAGGAAGSNTFGMSNLGNTSGTSGVISGSAVQFILAGGNNVTLSQSINGSSATITISAFNQSVQPEGTQTFGMSNLGNTSGTTGVVTGTGIQFVLAGGNNVTLSQSLNGSSGTITISAFNQSNQQMTLFATGNTTQSSSGTTNASSIIFRGEGIASIGITGGSIVVSVPAGGGAAGTNTLGMSNLGNTSGTSGVITGSALQLVFAGGNNITLSQSIDGVSATITISAGAGGAGVTKTGYDPHNLPGERLTGGILNASMLVQPMWDVPNFVFSQFNHVVTFSNATNSSGSFSYTAWVGIYTRNVSTLSMLHSTSHTTALTMSGTVGSWSLFSGQRNYVIPWTSTITEGNYWLGLAVRSSTAGAGMSVGRMILSNVNVGLVGNFGSAQATSQHAVLGLGAFTGTVTSVLASMAFSNIQGGTGATNLRQPIYHFGVTA